MKAGAILPFGPDVQYTSEKPWDSLELAIYPGADGHFTLYEDAGDGYEYEKGEYTTIDLSWNDKQGSLTIGPRQGTFPGMLRERSRGCSASVTLSSRSLAVSRGPSITRGSGCTYGCSGFG